MRLHSSSPTSSPPPNSWSVPKAPLDPILKLTDQYRADPNPLALNLGVGAYRDQNGQPHEFRAVTHAIAAVSSQPVLHNHQYLPIDGSPHFNNLSALLIFGQNIVQSKSVATVQTISGSGALRVALEFCRKVLNSSTVLVPDPTWSNHIQMVSDAKMALSHYAYYHPRTRSVDVPKLIADLSVALERTVVILQPCAHNPTGADIPRQTWSEILRVVRERKLIPLFDMAYQGMASGDIHQDAYPVRLFAQNVNTLVAHSFSKSMGLYNSRIGSLSVAVPYHPSQTSSIISQLKWIIRTMYSSPPADGARLVETILSQPQLHAEWTQELKQVTERMNDMRLALYKGLTTRCVPGDWNHILNTTGMFVRLGLSHKQVEIMRTNHHVYMTADSRINVAALTETTTQYLCDALAHVLSSA